MRRGDEVSVHAIAERGRLPVSSPGPGLSSARASLTAVHPNTFGAQKTLMIIVTFSDNPQPSFTKPLGAPAACSKCGTHLVPGSHYCASCGGRVAA